MGKWVFQMGLALQSVPAGTEAEQGHARSRSWPGPPPCSAGLPCKGTQFSLPAFNSLLGACENPVKCHFNPSPNFPRLG